MRGLLPKPRDACSCACATVDPNPTSAPLHLRLLALKGLNLAAAPFLPSPCLQTYAFHPHFHTIDAIPLTVKLPCSSHPNSYGRPPAACRSPIPRRLTPKAQETAVLCSMYSSLPLADRPSVWTSLVFGRIYGVYRTALVSFRTFFYPFQIRAPALHSSPSYSTLDFIPSTSPCCSSPSLSSCSMLRTSHPFSKIFTLSDTPLFATSPHRSVAGKTSPSFSSPLTLFLRPQFVKVPVLVVSNSAYKNPACGLVKGQATVTHLLPFLLCVLSLVSPDR